MIYPQSVDKLCDVYQQFSTVSSECSFYIVEILTKSNLSDFKKGFQNAEECINKRLLVSQCFFMLLAINTIYIIGLKVIYLVLEAW